MTLLNRLKKCIHKVPLIKQKSSKKFKLYCDCYDHIHDLEDAMSQVRTELLQANMASNLTEKQDYINRAIALTRNPSFIFTPVD